MPLALARWFCIASILLFWFAQNQNSTPISKSESKNEQSTTNENVPRPQAQTPPIQTDVNPSETKPTETERQAKQEDATSNAKEAMTRAEKIAIVLSVLTFLVLAFQTYIYNRQLGEMREMKGVSERQAAVMEHQATAMQSQLDTINRQADTMQGQLDIMRDQSHFMSETLVETRNMVAQNERAVAIAEMTAEASRQALYVSERPYVEVTKIKVSLPFVAETPIVYSVTIENKGRTPAYELKGAMYIDVREDALPENPEYRPVRTVTSNVTLSPGIPVRNKQTTNFVLPQEVISQIYERKWLVYVYGFETYKDGLTDNIHRTRYCYVFNPEENQFFAADYHNNSD